LPHFVTNFNFYIDSYLIGILSIWANALLKISLTYDWAQRKACLHWVRAKSNIEQLTQNTDLTLQFSVESKRYDYPITLLPHTKKLLGRQKSLPSDTDADRGNV